MVCTQESWVPKELSRASFFLGPLPVRAGDIFRSSGPACCRCPLENSWNSAYRVRKTEMQALLCCFKCIHFIFHFGCFEERQFLRFFSGGFAQ